MKYISILLLTFIAGCATLDRHPEIVRTVLKIGVRIAMHAVLNNNPNLAPYFASISTVFADTDSTKPDIIGTHLAVILENSPDLSINDRRLIMDATNIIITEYAKIYDEYKMEISNNTYLSILRAIGDVVYDYSSGISDRTVAADPGIIIEINPTTIVYIQ